MISWIKKLFTKAPRCSEKGCSKHLDTNCSNARCDKHCAEQCLQIGFGASINEIEKLIAQLSIAEIVVRCQQCQKKNRLTQDKEGDPLCGNCGSRLLIRRSETVRRRDDKLN